MMRASTSWLVVFLLFAAPLQPTDVPRRDPKVLEQLKSYLITHYMTPEDYVISKFKNHDVVFLGEHHRYKHDVQLVQGLIPLLYDAGIFTLAMEFARREDQPLIERLLNGAAYDEALARQIIFNMEVDWGYQDYVDIFKGAWRLNQQLPSKSRKFRILGVMCSWDWSVVQKQEDLYNNPVVMAKVWRGCSEEQWAQVILNDVVANGEKALVYSGMHHAFSAYRQPKYDESKHAFSGFGVMRMGNYVYNAIGKRAFTISLHTPWPSNQGYEEPSTYPADGYIDAVMADVEPKFRRVGFDTRGTPFGDLPGEASVYKYGYEKFTLSTYCDGYIFQRPLQEYEGVTPIQNWINQTNLAEARAQSDPKHRQATAEEFNRGIAEDADVQRETANLR